MPCMATLSHPDRQAPLLTTQEVAEILRVSTRTVRRLGQSGQLGRVHVGGRLTRYTPDSLDEMLAGHNDDDPAGNRVAVQTEGVTAPDAEL